jgi:hypothetical protein
MASEIHCALGPAFERAIENKIASENKTYCYSSLGTSKTFIGPVYIQPDKRIELYSRIDNLNENHICYFALEVLVSQKTSGVGGIIEKINTHYLNHASSIDVLIVVSTCQPPRSIKIVVFDLRSMRLVGQKANEGHFKVTAINLATEFEETVLFDLSSIGYIPFPIIIRVGDLYSETCKFKPPWPTR